jgi:PKD repeat protein
MILTLFVTSTRGADPMLAIKLNNTNTLEYCSSPVSIAELLSIEIAGTTNINGFKISFSEGYKLGEDKLEVVSLGTLSQNWYEASGSLELTGSTVIQDYVNAIRTIQYKNLQSIPTLGTRKITISLNDIDYLPETKHFYRFISKPNIKWTDSETEAKSDNMMYYGLRGYLANITSKAENDFINLKTQGLGWIGASDHAVEGEWRWVTGPEGLEEGTKGRLFWKGSGYQAKTNPVQFGPVKDALGNDYYQNWNRWELTCIPLSIISTKSDTTYVLKWEPNDYDRLIKDHEEDYAHITFSPNVNETLKWNDYPNNGGSAGYLIEFGGMPGEPVLNLTATIDLQVNTMLFNTNPVGPVCEGEHITLNQEDNAPVKAKYEWLPSESLSDPSIANPVATPKVSTNYIVTGTRGTCPSVTATFDVKVNPKPVTLLPPEYNICKGDQAILDPGPGNSYTWSNGAITQTIPVPDAGDYSVKLTSDKGCPGISSTKVVVHEYPVIDLSKLQTLICGDKATLVDISTNAASFLLESVDQKATVNGLSGLNVSVPDDGVYAMKYTAIHAYCPVSKPFELSFYRTPTVGLSIKPGECQRYNLDASYNGDADLLKARFTWIFGGDTIADGLGLIKEKIPLGINQSKRDLVLLVEQDGCSNKDVIPEIFAIPTLNLSVTKATLCQPEAFGFSATNSESGVSARYDWNFGDGITGTGDNPTHTYAKTGKYDVQVTVTTDKNCTNTALIKEMVFAAPVPDVVFSLSPLTCLDPGVNSIAYAGLVGNTNDKYIWDLTNLDRSEIVTDPGIKQGPWTFDLKTKPLATIGLKVISEFGCQSLPGSIILKRKPDFTIASTLLSGCVPFEPTLSGLINISDLADKVDFTWDFGDGSTGTGSSVAHTYNDPGKSYNITLAGKSSLTQCANEFAEFGLLKTYPKPKAAFSMDHKVVYNDKPDVKFTDLSTGKPSSWLWDFGDGVNADIQNPMYHFVKMGHQKVWLKVTNDELCTDTVSQNILVAFDRLFPPTGFSPNAPNHADRQFLLNSEGIVPGGYHFSVLSRWNDLIFEAKDEIKGWDGRMKNGALAPAGAYVWMLNFTDFLGRRHRQTGTVTLVY